MVDLTDGPHDALGIELNVNGELVSSTVPVRQSLADWLRAELGLLSIHLGCEHGVCGACTILVDGRSVRSCLMLAVQADGTDITTAEHLAEEGGLNSLQASFNRHGALQCGYCTPGFLMTATEYLREGGTPDRKRIKERLAGNLCRCTGYQSIVEAVASAAEEPGDQ